ncbi:MAG: hypothetical protein ACUVWX_07530 [Kiritimatiellia bacterium]
MTMQTVPPSELRVGMMILFNGVPHTVEDLHVTGAGQTKHKIHARIRNIMSGRHNEHTFQETEQVVLVGIEQRGVVFSYKDGDQYVFLNPDTYEELRLSTDQVGERHWFLQEDAEYAGTFIEGRLVDITIPDHVSMKVVDTAPPQRATQQSVLKRAVLEGGLEINVPMFIGPGDVVRVDTKTHKYAGKATGGPG